MKKVLAALAVSVALTGTAFAQAKIQVGYGYNKKTITGSRVQVLDRETGEILSATPFAYTTTRTGVDLKSGRPIEVAEKTHVMTAVPSRAPTAI